MTPLGTQAADRIVGFCDHLRLNGFPIGPAETGDIARYLSGRPIQDPAAARLGLKVLLAGNHEEWERFDQLFEAFWFARGRERPSAERSSRADSRSAVSGRQIWQRHLEGDALENPSRGPGREAPAGADVEDGSPGRLIASEATRRGRTDLRHFSDPGEIAEAEALALKLARAIRYRLSRRYRRNRKGSRLDLRRTIRANIGHGGEPLTLVRRSRPDRPVRIVVFLDVSGSMTAYSRFFLQFVKGLVSAWLEADAYLFHTRLVRITEAVRERDSVKAMTDLSLMAEGFGGGTKLGDSLRRFNDLYAKRSLNARTVVIVLSDGYDTGSPETLARELTRLKRRARRLVWLNPLLGWQSYQPVNSAMAAALPHIDHFAAANTLEALAAIETDLARL